MRERERKIGRETGVGERDTGEREREIQGEREEETGEKEREIQGRKREGYRGERERERKRERERERETGEKEREGAKEKSYEHKKIHGILSSRASIRLPFSRPQ